MKKWMVSLLAALLVSAFAAAASAAPLAADAQKSIVQQIREAEFSEEELAAKDKQHASLAERIKGIMAEGRAAAAQPAALPKVAILYVNNAKSTYDDEVNKEIFKYLNQALPASAYDLVDGAVYSAKLNQMGYSDISTAERADFMDVFAQSGIDYCLYLEISPFVARDKMTFFTIGKDITTSIPMKIIDLSTGKYIYTGKFTEKASDSTIIGDIGNKSVALKALDSAGEKILAAIQERLPKTKLPAAN